MSPQAIYILVSKKADFNPRDFASNFVSCWYCNSFSRNNDTASDSDSLDYHSHNFTMRCGRVAARLAETAWMATVRRLAVRTGAEGTCSAGSAVVGVQRWCSTTNLGRRLVYNAHGDPNEVLQLQSYDVPTLSRPDQLRVDMLAAPINPADINQVGIISWFGFHLPSRLSDDPEAGARRLPKAPFEFASRWRERRSGSCS